MGLCKACKKDSANIKKCTTNTEGLHHSFRDRPSVITGDGVLFWHKNGCLHRETGPSVDYSKSTNRKTWDNEFHLNGNPCYQKRWKEEIERKNKMITFDTSDPKFRTTCLVFLIGLIVAFCVRK